MVDKSKAIDSQFRVVKEKSFSNPFHEAPVDTAFKVKRSNKEAFFHGVKKAGTAVAKGSKATGRGLIKGAKVTGKGVLATGKATTKGILATGKATATARRVYYEKRSLGLERRQNIATYKANIASQKQLRLQQQTVSDEAKLKRLEIKAARREFLRQQRLQRQASRAKPLGDAGSRKPGPLSDKNAFKVNLKPRKKGGFFS